MNFTDTRSRKSDPQSSKDAAKVAAMDKSSMIRVNIRFTVTMRKQDNIQGWTAKEIANYCRLNLSDVYRRLPEVSGIKRHPHFRRDGCSVYVSS